MTKAVRYVRRRESVDIDITGQSELHGPADAMWETLKRKCAVCRSQIKQGDMYRLIMYVENGKQFSGGAHEECVMEVGGGI